MDQRATNKEILDLLGKLVEKFPEQRFGQILFNYVLNYSQTDYGQIHIDDPFYEESKITFYRILCKIKKLKIQY